jgi:hypothetical protein
VPPLRSAPRLLLWPLPALVVAFALAACSGETAIVVEVASPDLRVPDDVDQLRFDVTSTGGPMAGGTYPITRPWPHTLAVRPAMGRENDIVTVLVTGFKGGVEVARGTNMAPFVRGETVIVEVRLTRCAPGTCPPPPGDGGVDMGLDLGLDMGEPVDGGVDLGDVDAGMDAGTDLGVDLGTDLGADLGRDLGTDLGVDMGFDLGFDMGVDLGPPDLGVDMGRPRLVISELTTGPGTNEYVEIHNAGDAPFVVPATETLRVRYLTAAHNPSSSVIIPSGVMIPPGGFYLVGGSSYPTTGPVPPDQTGSLGLNELAGGHVVLSLGMTDLDRVGYGSATMPEGAAAPLPPTTAALERKAVASSTADSMSAGGADERRGNGHDTNNNASDFVVRPTKDPQNSSSPPEMP